MLSLPPRRKGRFEIAQIEFELKRMGILIKILAQAQELFS